ncbi:MAG: arginine deiminase-related protein [Phycisphaerae bacterium]
MGVIDSIEALPRDLLASCRAMSAPGRVLMCPPDWFDVIDVKNPHMQNQVGHVDRAAARAQWEALRATFADCGAQVYTLPPVPECEDMVFCANQTFVGLDAAGAPLCVPSRMKHASRRREVPAFERWFAQAGYRIAPLTAPGGFEGGGDALWHPRRGLIWGGYGHRTEPQIYNELAALFDVPVVRLRLCSDRFYHLDTCLCALDERTALVHAASFEPRGLELIRALFSDVIECPADEAETGMACNAAAIGERSVVLQRGNPRTVAALRQRGFDAREVETGEYLRSGGSVFCMKMMWH